MLPLPPSSSTCLASSYTLANSTSAQQLLYATTNGAFNAAGSTTYFFEAEFDITGLSASSHSLDFGFGGGATITSIKYVADTNTGAAGTPESWVTAVTTVATATAISGSVTTTTFQARIRGVIRINAGGDADPADHPGVALRRRCRLC